MELEIKRSRLAILPLCLAAALSAIACGDDAKSPDDSDKSPSTTDDDGGDSPVAKPDAGGSKDASSGSKPDASSSGDKEDAGTGKTDASTPSTGSGNTIYTGAPDCSKIVKKLAGGVGGTQVSYDLAELSETDETSFVAQEEGADRGNIELTYEEISTDGKPGKITEGVLELPSQYDSAEYCVIDGEAQFDKTLGEDDGERLFFTITKVQKKVDGDCDGEDITATLKGCSFVP